MLWASSPLPFRSEKWIVTWKRRASRLTNGGPLFLHAWGPALQHLAGISKHHPAVVAAVTQLLNRPRAGRRPSQRLQFFIDVDEVETLTTSGAVDIEATTPEGVPRSRTAARAAAHRWQPKTGWRWRWRGMNDVKRLLWATAAPLCYITKVFLWYHMEAILVIAVIKLSRGCMNRK